MVERFEPRAHSDNSLVKETRDQVYMAANILLLYGPKAHVTANVEKTGPKRMWLQVYMANGTVPLYVSKTQTLLSIKRLPAAQVRLPTPSHFSGIESERG